MANTFRCTLVTPEQQLLDVAVTYATFPAHDGQVGLMKGRAPLLAALGDGAMRLDFEDGGSRWFFVGGGFAQMKDDKLSLVAEEATTADEIVRAKADEDLKKAIATVARSDEEVERKFRSILRAKQMTAIATKHGGKV